MLDRVKGTLQTHLKDVGASDLLGTAFLRGAYSATFQSRENPAVALHVENGEVQMMYGMNDAYLKPVCISYDDNGAPASVGVPNHTRSGRQQFMPDNNIVSAIINAAKTKPVGPGYAVAALTKAAKTPNAENHSGWGISLAADYADMDTRYRDVAQKAVNAVQAQWQKFYKPTAR